MDVRSCSRFRLAILSTVAPIVATVAMVAAMLALEAAPAAAARRVRHAAAAAQEASAVPLDQIHVLGDRPAPFGLNAKAAMMIDARSGATLYAYNEHVKIQPASLAKLMTFYLVLKALHQGRLTPDTMVTVSEKAWRLSMNSGVSRMFLQVGQKVSVNDLLYGLMVSSGNDAAVALAEYLGGSSEAFAEQMNQQAKELGLSETHFENPDGLPVPEMYTTAFDMVKLGRAITQRFPDATKYTSAKDFTFDKIHQPNFNTLLFYDARVNGLKTGHVEEAGYHLVASAHANGMDLISAVLGTPSSSARRVETEKLVDWAFRTFVSVQPDWHKTLPDKVRVYGGAADMVAVAPVQIPGVTVEHGQENRVTLAGSFDAKYLVAPIRKGQQVGALVLMVDGKPQSTVPMLATAAVARGGLVKRMIDRLRLRL
jgi:serine-type D-Ala-D-Ala carboxypeptidase (penicillin-binding protein 5/6)